MVGSTYKRNYVLDIVRIVAILTVVMIHCSTSFVTHYPLFTYEFISGNLFDGISRIGVPLFLMVSGALFLDEQKEVTFKSILSKNIKTLAIITITWAIIYSVVYNVILPVLTNENISAKNAIGGIITGHYHMWYLYMIMGLYIITPFLKKFVCKENKQMVLLFIIISFCFQFFTPIINIICQLGLDISIINVWMRKFQLDFFGGYITYFLVGWYIVHIGIKQKWITRVIYFFGVASIIFTVLYVHFTGDYDNAYSYLGVPVFVYSISVFLAINNIDWKLKEKSINRLTKFSKLTFGVYIVHVLVITVYRRLFPYSRYSVLYIVVCFVVVVCSSFFVSYIISKIPVLKKIIKA